MENTFMKRALELSLIAYKNGDIPIGCVVVKDGEIIGEGYNKKELLKNAVYHGEIIALSEAAKHLNSYHLEECEVYVNLEPCAMCMGAMLNFRIKKLYIGTENPRMGCAGSNLALQNVDGFNHSFPVEFGIEKKLSSYIISRFFKNLRRKKSNML